MPLFGPRTAGDINVYAELVNMWANAEGRAELLPHNCSPNPGWVDIDYQGDPEDWSVAMPEEIVGWYPDVSVAGNRTPGVGVPVEQTRPPRRATLSRQTANPIPLTVESWLADKPILRGVTPIFERDLAANIPPPAKPIMQAFTRTLAGFPAGTYGYAYELAGGGGGGSGGGGGGGGGGGRGSQADRNRRRRNRGGRRTDRTITIGDVTFTPGSFGLDGLMGAGGSGNNKRKNRNNKRRKDVKDTRTSKRGTGRQGQATEDATSTNRSAISFVTVGEGQFIRVFTPEDAEGQATVWRIFLTTVNGGPSTLSLYASVDLANFSAAYLDLGGPVRESGKAPRLDNRSGATAPDIRLAVDVETRRGNFDLQVGTYRFAFQPRNERGEGVKGNDSVEAIVTEIDVGHRFRVRTKRRIRDNVTMRLWVKKDGVDYFVKDKTTGESFLSLEQWAEGVDVYGYPSDREPAGLRWGLVRATPPTDVEEEDYTVMNGPSPTGSPDQPIAWGAVYPDVPATYLGATHFGGAAGGESVPSDHASVTLTGTQTFRLIPERGSNALPNAQGNERLSDGSIIDWTKTNISGSPTSGDNVDGVFYYDNSSGTAITTNYPVWQSSTVDVDPVSDYIDVVGDLVVNFWVAGTSELVLEELNAANSVVATTVLLTLSGNGSKTLMDAPRRFGVGGTAFNAATAKVRKKLRQTGASNRHRADFSNLAIKLNRAILRKFEEGPPNSIASSTVSPATPFPAHSTYYVGIPPTPVGTTPPSPAPAPGGGTTTTELSLVDFESGAFPGGSWTHTSGGSATSVVSTGAKLYGTYGWQVQDASASASGFGYLSRTFSAGEVNGVALAVRLLFDLVSTSGGGTRTLAQIKSSTGTLMAELLLVNGTTLQIRSNDDDNNLATTTLITGLSAGTRVDVELRASGGDTSSGRLEGSVGLNGAQRSTTVSQTSIDWSPSSFVPRQIVMGSLNSTAVANLTDIYFDQLVVTRTGDILNREAGLGSGTGGGGSGTAQPLPDRPPITYPSWAANTAISLNELRVPTVNTGRRYVASTAPSGAMSGTTEPTFPLTTSATVRDNAGMTAVTRGQVLTLATGKLKPSGTSADAEWYEVTTAGTTHATIAPTYPTTAGTTVTDGTAVLTCRKTVVWTENGSRYREFTPASTQINQIWMYIEPGTRPEDWGPTTDVPIPVKPGQVYTHACYMKWSIFPGALGPSRPLVLTAYGEGLDPLDLGSIDGSLGITGTGAWQELVKEVTIPTVDPEDPLERAYTEVRVSSEETQCGVYVFQEHLFSEGSLTTSAARDAMRDFGRASSGSIRMTVDTLPEQSEFTPDPILAQSWCDFDVEQAIPALAAGNFISNAEFRSSEDLTSWSTETATKDLVPQRRYLQFACDMTGDGFNTPSIPSQGIWLETRRNVACLTDRYRQDFPGVAVVGHVPSDFTAPDQDVTTVGGKPFSTPVSDELRRNVGFTIVGFSGELASFLLGMDPNDEVHLEDPFANGDTGRIDRIRFYDLLEVSEAPMGRIKTYLGTKRSLVTCNTPAALIVEAAAMKLAR